MADENTSNPNSFFEIVTGNDKGSALATGHPEHDRDYKGVSGDSENLDPGSPLESDKLLEGDEPVRSSPGSASDEAASTTGSTGMPHEARRVLVHLMRQGVILASQKPILYDLVCRYEADVRRHLSEVYLQLVLDSRAGVVFVASKDSEYELSRVGPGEDSSVEDTDEDYSSLISRRTLSLYDTLLLLVLRKHYQDREAAGEQKISIDLERLESYLTPFLPLTDHASQDRKKLIARVKEMVRRKVLSHIRGSEERYEITPVIRYVVNADFLESMLGEYIRLADEMGTDFEQEETLDDNVSQASLSGMEDPA